MRYLQNIAHRTMIATQSVGTSTTVTGAVDTKGFNSLRISYNLGTAAATSGAGLATAKLQASDDTVASNFADVAGYTVLLPTSWATAATNITGPAAVADVDLSTVRKRYLRIVATSGTTAQVHTVEALLGHPLTAKITAAQVGAGVLTQPSVT